MNLTKEIKEKNSEEISRIYGFLNYIKYLSVLHLIQIISSPSLFPAIVMKVTQLRQNTKSTRLPL